MGKSKWNETDNPAITGFKGLCPRCQRGRLFASYLKLGPSCSVCGLDYSFADPADGPAFFSMSIVAIPALGFALWFQFKFGVPIWAHLFVTVPLTVAACVALLRPLKGWLVCSQYFHKAHEGSIDHDWGKRSKRRDRREG